MKEKGGKWIEIGERKGGRNLYIKELNNVKGLLGKKITTKKNPKLNKK